MRRLFVVLGVVAAILGSAVLMGSGGEDGYRVDVIFDNSDFLVPGQDVKIAGAKVGTIEDVTLTADRHSRVEALITKPGFAPFRANADCTVQLQSLIGERFVECFPGSLPSKALEPNEDGVTTVPLANTHSPVALDLVLSTFKAPAPERLALLLSSLGAGTAGRGDDLNVIIRRAAPALQQSTRVLEELNRNRTQLQGLITDGNAVMAKLDDQRESLARFVHATGDLSGTLADRRAELATTIRDLPATLEALNPYLDTVSTIARDTQPTLESLDRSAAPLDALFTELDRTSDSVQPALGALRETADELRAAVPDARPVVGELARMARATTPAARLASDLFTSLHDQGAVEGAQKFLYYAVAATARFDNVSHLLGAYPIVTACSMYQITPAQACYSNFDGAPVARTAPEKPKRTARRPVTRTPRPTSPATAPAPAAPVPTAAPKLPQLPGLDKPLKDVLDQVQNLLDKTTKPLVGVGDRTSENLNDLLTYLLK